MTREEIKKIIDGITDEQLGKILDINSADIGKAKKDYETVKAENEALKGDKKSLEDKITELSEKSESAEDYKKQLEDLKQEIADKEKADKEAKEAQEKADGIKNRFEAVIGDKQFSHEAIKEAYHKKFGEALESKDFEGKSDADIFHELTKDDSTAFSGVQSFKLEGGTSKGIGTEIDDAQARAIMGLPPLK